MRIILSSKVQHVNPDPTEEQLENAALSAFFVKISSAPRRPFSVNGFLDELLELYLKCNLDSSLRKLTAATALAAGDALEEARIAYNAGIQKFSHRITSFTRQSGLATKVISTMMCLFYESIMFLKEGRSSISVHEKGLMSLLRASENPFFCTNTAEGRVLEAGRHYVANYCLETGVSASDALGQAAIMPKVASKNLSRLLTRSIVRVADFAAASEARLTTTSKHILLKALENAHDIDNDLERWVQNVPDCWAVKRSQELLVQGSQFTYESRIDLYYDIQVASIWNSYRRARLVLLQCITQILQTLQRLEESEDYSMLEKEALLQTGALADDVCASVPFHIGTQTDSSNLSDVIYPSLGNDEVAAIHRQIAVTCGWIFILLPLRNLMKLHFVTNAQRVWATWQHERVCRIVAREHGLTGERVAEIFDSAIPFTALALPINSRHGREAGGGRRDVLDPMLYRNCEPERNGSTMKDLRRRGRITSSKHSTVVADPVKSPTRNRLSARDSAIEPRCFEDCCNGRRFANWSNLERHRKEKDATRWACPSCGVGFTRRSAQKLHLRRGRCHSVFGRPKHYAQTLLGEDE